ncbi:hypothetical protein FDENT_11569 [Fusarium denticulatum]|uniref:Uncharacterized protein n=1 Tax=Fusarium denticulatum TaxID=48507 RepID=A0A8H5WNE9_9HYPO|nr:hypothetical protein FDENT_11569 [Fusarium denticulatum]
MNPKHITYPTSSNSHGEEEIPIFLQSITRMGCSPYWYRFFVNKLPPRPWPITINGRPFTIAPETTEDLPLTPIPGVYYDRAQGMTSLFQHIEPQASNTNIFVGNPDLSICVNIDARQDSFPETSLRAMARDVTETFSSHPAYPKVMEVMLTMDQKIVITVGGGLI